MIRDTEPGHVLSEEHQRCQLGSSGQPETGHGRELAPLQLEGQRMEVGGVSVSGELSQVERATARPQEGEGGQEKSRLTH